MKIIKKILKWILYIMIFILVYASARLIWAEIKYFNPRNIVDKTVEYQNKNNRWISINHKEKVDEYTRIDSVIYCGEIACNFPPMEGIDISTFEVLPGTNYARDKNNIFYPLTIICADFTDCGVCYCDEYILTNINRQSFRYLDKEYATDGKKVFFRGELIEAGDGRTFRVIKGPEFFYFAVDANNVYKHDIIFPDADPESFYYDKNDDRNITVRYNERFIIGDKENEWEFNPPTRITKIEKR